MLGPVHDVGKTPPYTPTSRDYQYDQLKTIREPETARAEAEPQHQVDVDIPCRVPTGEGGPVKRVLQRIVPERVVAERADSVDRDPNPYRPDVPRSVVPVRLNAPYVKGGHVDPEEVLKTRGRQGVHPTGRVGRHTDVNVDHIHVRVTVANSRATRLTLVHQSRRVHRHRHVVGANVRTNGGTIEALNRKVTSLLT